MIASHFRLGRVADGVRTVRAVCVRRHQFGSGRIRIIPYFFRGRHSNEPLRPPPPPLPYCRCVDLCVIRCGRLVQSVRCLCVCVFFFVLRFFVGNSETCFVNT